MGKLREAKVKIVSEDIEVGRIAYIEADFAELRVHMVDGRIVVFGLEDNGFKMKGG